MNAIDLHAAFASRTPTKTIWVSPNGNNSNKGDAGSPLKTIQAAVDKAAPGTTIMVKAGTYKGSVDLSGVHGTADKPIKLISADGQGAAKIVGSASKAAIQAYKISNVGIYDFEVVSNTTSGDIGGMKIFGPWDNPARNIVISGNIVSGKGTDGIKLFNGAKDILVVGNTIKGNWRQEAIDNVSVENVVFAYNTIKGSAKNTAITMKAGSRNIEVFGNEIDLTASVGIYVGGHGTSRLNRSFPKYWEGFEAKNIHVHDNVIAERITGKSLVFVGANSSTVEKNYFADNVGSVDHKVPGEFTYHSFNNKLINNSVDSAGFFKPDSGESKGYVVSGNKVGGPKPSAGVDSPKLDSLLGARRAGEADPAPSGDTGGFTPPPTAPETAPPAPAPAPATDGAWTESAAFTKTIDGTSASQTLSGTTGHDKLVGRGGEDVLKGGKGDDLYIVDSTGDAVVELAGQGTDTVYLWTNKHVLDAHVENLTVRTGVGAKAIGNALDNIIEGGAGADFIDGRAGRDLLSGGAGADTFVIRRGQAGDEITDLASVDTIRLDGFALGSFADVKARMSQKAAGTLIDLGGGETLLLRDVQASTLKAGQFEFANVAATSSSPAPASSPAPSFRDPSSWQLSEGARKNVGTTGNDTMTGSKGDEIYVIGQTGDRIAEQSGHGTDTAFQWIRTFALSDHVENLIVKTSKDANATGNGLDNVILGGTGSDVIKGLGGADLLTGGGGKDTFVYTSLADSGDVITDFKRGTDTLDLRPLTAGLTGESVFFSKLDDGLAVMVGRNGTEHGLVLLHGLSDGQLTVGTDILV